MLISPIAFPIKSKQVPEKIDNVIGFGSGISVSKVSPSRNPKEEKISANEKL